MTQKHTRLQDTLHYLGLKNIQDYTIHYIICDSKTFKITQYTTLFVTQKHTSLHNTLHYLGLKNIQDYTIHYIICDSKAYKFTRPVNKKIYPEKPPKQGKLANLAIEDKFAIGWRCKSYNMECYPRLNSEKIK